MYVKSGWTQRARLDGKVQGVVVQASNDTVGSSTRGKATVTFWIALVVVLTSQAFYVPAGSFTSRYSCPASKFDNGVVHPVE